MDRNNIQVRDKSDERKYFTIVPNIILDTSDALTIALYLQLKRLAWDAGLAYPSRAYLIDRLKVSHPTLKKAMMTLLENNWIKYEGTVDVNTAGGVQKMKAYSIVDIWKENVDAYQEENEGGKNKATPLSTGGKNQTTKGGKNTPPNKMDSLNKITPSNFDQNPKTGEKAGDTGDSKELTPEERRAKLKEIRENVGSSFGMPPLVTRSQ